MSAAPESGPPAGVGTRRLLARPAGRQLEVIDAGPADGVALVLCHGTPGSGLLLHGWAQACAQRGVRLVGYSRPGYGASTRQPGRSVADAAGDVAAIADALGCDRLLTAGHSGGGSHALASAALLGDRVIATAVIAGAAPASAPGLDWLAGQDPDNVQEFRAAQVGGATLAALLEAWRAEMLAEPPETGGEAGAGELFAAMISDADRAASTPENSAFARARRDHGLAPGIWGWYDDDLTETVAWGFELTAIRRPVAVWHGAQDRFVPFAHGRWLAQAIPDARAHLLQDEGHFSIVEARLGDVVDDLLELAHGAR